jgi:hypothetical protein
LLLVTSGSVLRMVAVGPAKTAILRDTVCS